MCSQDSYLIVMATLLENAITLYLTWHKSRNKRVVLLILDMWLFVTAEREKLWVGKRSETKRDKRPLEGKKTLSCGKFYINRQWDSYRCFVSRTFWWFWWHFSPVCSVFTTFFFVLSLLGWNLRQISVRDLSIGNKETEENGCVVQGRDTFSWCIHTTAFTAYILTCGTWLFYVYIDIIDI